MRLDEYLVSEGLISSRSRAHRYIERGQVKVNGEVAIKPSRKIEYGSKVEISDEDQPEGYFKLKGIQEQSGLIGKGASVLDIGSSAGGFLIFASAIAADVVGIEYSEEFRPQLDHVTKGHSNVHVLFGDAFTMDISLAGGPFDVVLNDMTVDPSASVEVLARFLPLLRTGGKIMQVLKLGEREDYQPLLDLLEEKGLKIEKVLKPEKREAYVIAIKSPLL